MSITLGADFSSMMQNMSRHFLAINDYVVHLDDFFSSDVKM